MKYGYTIARPDSSEVFKEAVPFIVDELQYTPDGDVHESVYGDLVQQFKKDGKSLVLKSDTEDGSVEIVSDVELPITSLYKWTTDD